MGLYRLPKIIGKDNKPPFGARINWNHPLSQGLVGAWLFNEGGGIAVVDVTNIYRNYDGTIHNPASNMWVGPWLKFPGSGTTILTLGNWPQYRIATFVAGITFISNSSYQQIINSDQTSGSARVFQYRITDTGSINFLAFSSGLQQVTGSTTLQSGSYYNLCGKVDGSNISIFINGKSDVTPGACGLLDTAALSVTHIGAFQQNVGDYVNISYISNSYFSYVYIYNRPLSDGEILLLHANPYQMFLPSVWDAYFVPAAAPPPTGGKSIFGYDSIFHAGGIIQT